MMKTIPTKTLLSSLLLSAVALMNGGCIQKYFYEESEIIDSPTPVTTTNPYNYDYQPPANYQPKSVTPPSVEGKIDIECSGEVAPQESKCNRGEITRDQLSGKNIQKTATGVVHSLKSIQGHQIKIVERPTGFLFPNYQGKIIILVMFGKDCPHCIQGIPVLKRIKQDYRGQVEVIAVQSQDRMDPYIARNFITQNRINYPIIEGEDATNLQYFIQSTYGWTGILPFTMVVKNGVTELTYPGGVSYDEIRADMSTLF
ncbi:MAG: TlpA family protein disulfide reductase [Campylobacterales bacterium]|nr:TlpA family protein disulfide reductase [Campylobacterales bacterium]